MKEASDAAHRIYVSGSILRSATRSSRLANSSRSPQHSPEGKCPNLDERNTLIEIFDSKRFELEPKHALIPGGILGGFVVGKDIGSLLRFGEMIKDDHRILFYTGPADCRTESHDGEREAG